MQIRAGDLSRTPSPTNLAVIDLRPRKAPYFLRLRRYLEPSIRCFYFSRRPVARAFIERDGCVAYPRRDAPRSVPQLSNDALCEAIGRKEQALRQEQAVKIARSVLPEIEAFLDHCHAHAVLIWNGWEVTAALGVYAARQRGLPVIFMEHGSVPGTMQVDLEGVAYQSSLTKLVARGDAQLPPDRELDAAVDRVIDAFKRGLPPHPPEMVVPARYRMQPLTRARYAMKAQLEEWQRERVWRKGRTLGLDKEDPLPARFVLVPLQVKKDPQLILHSPIVRNDLRRLLQLVLDACATIDPQLRLVAKLHPLEAPDAQLSNFELLRDFPQVRFVSKIPVRDLLATATAVVTINSTLGFEALMCGTPIVTLGRSFYASPHLVEPVHSEAELPGALLRALTRPVPTQQRRAFLRFVTTRYFVQANYDDHSERSFEALAQRIRELLSQAAVQPAAKPALRDACTMQP